MSAVVAVVLVLAALVAIGLVWELPKIRTFHINQPAERRRREIAARKTLAALVGGTAAAAFLAAAVWCWL
jgi:hypothetical protein